jgi:diguanylate cyclase (GGDEF)-like protein
MRVVLVAGAQSLRQSIAAILETRGHEVLCFAEADRALRHLEADPSANAFVVAGAESTMAGMEICWEARLLASFERPIYICMIARPMPSDMLVEALDCGADDVLQLPLSADELYARLRSAERVNQMQLKLVEMATRDGLTGMLNRPAFFDRATKMCRDAKAPLAAIMVDIDHFKAINDRFGHAAGDKALRAVARCLDGRAEIAGRLGGEEFALLIAQDDPDEAWRAAEALRGDIAARDIEIEGNALRLTCSFGVAVGAPTGDIDDLLRRADAALYTAKRAGRNLVAFYDPETPAVPNQPDSIVRCNKDPAARPRRRVAS